MNKTFIGALAYRLAVFFSVIVVFLVSNIKVKVLFFIRLCLSTKKWK